LDALINCDLRAWDGAAKGTFTALGAAKGTFGALGGLLG
jgi:hypothetical protein